MAVLQTTWFVIIVALVTGFMVMGGTDFGAGFWYLFTPRGRERMAILKAIGPVWDGNEVWLVTAGALVFAAFPPVYASLFSALYLPVMLLAFALILRTVAIEFAAQDVSPKWNKAWDMGFGVGSILSMVLLGAAMGNVLRGIPMDDHGNFTGTFLGILNPYALLIALTGLAMVATHGALFLQIRMGEKIASRTRRWAGMALWSFVILYISCVIASIFTQPRMMLNFTHIPALWALPVLTLLLIILIGFKNHAGDAAGASRFSVASIIGLFATAATTHYPRMLPSLNGSSHGYTIANGSSSALTLTLMLPITLIGMGIVISYTAFVRKQFRDK
ncbi:MAG: cytochrome d ubiquinol oxidase subunit II [Armatimonadota bacterium]|nr:cytochrome d ubiquinol oxidase subunit II [bacterium]